MISHDFKGDLDVLTSLRIMKILLIPCKTLDDPFNIYRSSCIQEVIKPNLIIYKKKGTYLIVKMKSSP